MKKRLTSLIICAMSVLILSGCAIPSIQDLSESDEAAITEYAAGLMLKYSDSFDFGVLDDEQLEAAQLIEDEKRAKDEKAQQLAQEYLDRTSAAKKDKEDKKNKDKGDKNTESGVSSEPGTLPVQNIAEFYGIEGFEVIYNGYEISDSYSDGGFMSVFPDEGRNLYIVSFTLANVSGQDAMFDIFDISSKFQISVNGEKKVTADSTLLLNDLATYKDTIPAGGTASTVLLFDIKENINPESLQLYLVNGDKTGSMVLE